MTTPPAPPDQATVAVMAKLYLTAALDEVEQVLAVAVADLRQLRATYEQDLTGPEPFRAFLSAVSRLDRARPEG
jgi:hypothetical protein